MQYGRIALFVLFWGRGGAAPLPLTKNAMPTTLEPTMPEHAIPASTQKARDDSNSAMRSEVLTVAALTLLALALRLAGLNQQLWYDEMTTLVQSVRQPFLHILTTYTSKNQHLLYSLLARLCIVVFGEHNWSLRLPAAVFGAACVPALYAVARGVTSRRESLLAAAMMTFSYHHVWFSQNARGYTGAEFWTLLATWLFVRGLDEGVEHGVRIWAAYGIALGLGTYTHLSMGAVVVAHGLVWFGWVAMRKYGGHETWPPKRALQPLLGFVVAGALAIALYVPILPQLMARTVANSQPMVQSDWTSPVWTLLEAARGLGAGTVLGVAAIGGGLVLMCAGVFTLFRRNATATLLMLLPGAVTAGALLKASQNLWPRFFFFLIGFAFLFLVRGGFALGRMVAWLFSRGRAAGEWWGNAIVAVMLLASLWPLRSAYLYPKQDFQGAMRYVDAHRKPGEAVATTSLAVFPYREYYGRDWTAVETQEQLERVRAASPVTWLVYWSPIYMQSREPEVWNVVRNEFSTVAVFRGTLGDAQIYVCRSEAVTGAKQKQ